MRDPCAGLHPDHASDYARGSRQRPDRHCHAVNLFDDRWGNGCGGCRWVVVRSGCDGSSRRRPLHRR
jgi:hypothetical protein